MPVTPALHAPTPRNATFCKHSCHAHARLCGAALLASRHGNSDRPLRQPRCAHAATVVMLRDGPAGLEVFLLKRHGLSDVLGGAYVFPGGKVDLDDAKLDMQAHLDCRRLRIARGAERAANSTSPLPPRCMSRRCARPSRKPACCMRTARMPRSAAMALATAARRPRFRRGAGADGAAARTPAGCSRGRAGSRRSVGGVMRKRFDTRFFLAAVPDGPDARATTTTRRPKACGSRRAQRCSNTGTARSSWRRRRS